MPLQLPGDRNAIYLGGLFILAMLGTAYLASEIVLPLVLACILKFLLQPAVRTLEHLYVTRTIASLLVILLVFATIIGFTAAISGSASTWAAKLPQGISRLEDRLAFLQPPIDALQRFMEGADRHPERESSPAASNIAKGSTLMMNLMVKMFTSAQSFADFF